MKENGVNRRRMKIAKNKINLLAKEGDVNKLKSILDHLQKKLEEMGEPI